MRLKIIHFELTTQQRPLWIRYNICTSYVKLDFGGRKNSKVACLGPGFEARIFLEHKCYGFIEKGGTAKTKTGNYEETRG